MLGAPPGVPRIPFVPKPIPRRLPERKRMTIAIGILATDGVVIAADTQESYSYYGGAKIGVNKILSRVIDGRGRSFAATGAGSGGHIDSLNQELADDFAAVALATSFEQRMRNTVQKFYKAHVIEMQLGAELRPHVLIGATWGGRAHLWKNEESAVVHCKHYEAVGSGRAHAMMLLNRLLPAKSETTIDVAARIAAYVVHHVKSYVEGCGMSTHVTVLRNGGAQYLAPNVVDALEGQYTAYLALEARLVSYMVGRPLENEGTALDGVMHWLREMRAGVLDLDGTLAVSADDKGFQWSDAAPPTTVENGYVSVSGDAVVRQRRQRRPALARKRVPQGSRRGRKGRPPSRG